MISVSRITSIVGALTFCVLGMGLAADGERISVNLYPEKNQAKTNPVVLTFVGKLFDNLTFRSEESELPPGLSPQEQFIIKIVRLGRSASLDEIINSWAPADRSEIRQLLSNEKTLEGNRGFYRNITTSTILARIDYGSYWIFMVRHSGPALKAFVKDYPVKEENGQTFLTNDLRGDPVFGFITTKYAQSLTQGK